MIDGKQIAELRDKFLLENPELIDISKLGTTNRQLKSSIETAFIAGCNAIAELAPAFEEDIIKWEIKKAGLDQVYVKSECGDIKVFMKESGRCWFTRSRPDDPDQYINTLIICIPDLVAILRSLERVRMEYFGKICDPDEECPCGRGKLFKNCCDLS